MMTIQALVKESLGVGTRRSQWAKSVVVAAWNKLFPRVGQQLQKLFIKKGVAYIKLESLILAHDLRRNKSEVLSGLQQKILELGESEVILQDIAFL